MTIGLRRRNQELTVGQFRIQESQRHRIDRGRGQSVWQAGSESCEQGLLRTIISQTLCDEDAGGKTVGRRAVALARPLIRGEEERPISFDWSAEQPAEDVALQSWPLHTCRFQKRIVGVKRIVAEVFVSSAVKRVRAAS